jgi:hypothetical protein
MSNPLDRVFNWLIDQWEQNQTRDFDLPADATRTCFRWERDIDRLGFADPQFGYIEERHGSYRTDNLGGLAYKPWIFRRQVGYLRQSDPRQWTEPKRFRVQLVPWGEYKHCTHPVAIVLSGEVVDFVPDLHVGLSCARVDGEDFELTKWHAYLLEMHGRGYKVFGTLLVRASSLEHEFNLLVSHLPPDTLAKWR